MMAPISGPVHQHRVQDESSYQPAAAGLVLLGTKVSTRPGRLALLA
jgi:hypothetical protein